MLRKFFRDKVMWITGFIGLVLMLLTLHFDINPVEGSVVPEYIQGTGIHIFLFVTSIPAWIAALMVSTVIPVSFPVMACIMQILLYGIIGKMIHYGMNFFKAQ
jgi:hypothetical protein